MTKFRLKHPLDDIDPLIMPGVNPEESCIYIFFIDGKGCYVGKSDGQDPKNRWWKDYSLNVKHMIDGAPYHIRGQDFRPVHHALHEARKECLRATLIIYENLTGKELEAREDGLIRAIGTLNRPRRKNPSKTENQVADIVDIAIEVAETVKTVEKIAETVEKVIEPRMSNTMNHSGGPQTNDWLDYQVEATKNTSANPFLEGCLRCKRFNLLAQRSSNIVIREYRALCQNAELGRGSRKYFWAAYKHQCVKFLDQDGNPLTRPKLEEFLNKIKT